MTKVLFLDIDGVCNSEEFMRAEHERTGRMVILGIDPKPAALVRQILADTGAKLVISSTWRHSEHDLQVIRDQVHPDIYGITPRCASRFRGDEVRAWLEEHPEVGPYAILDDDGDFHRGQHLFQTSFKIGLTQEIADQVVKSLLLQTMAVDSYPKVVAGDGEPWQGLRTKATDNS